MKRIVAAALVLSGLCSVVSAQNPPGGQPAPKLESTKEKASYAIGLNIGSDIKENGLDLVPELLVRGILDALQGNKPVLDEKQCDQVLAAFQQEMAAKRDEKMKSAATKNKADGEAFLAANQKQPGVKVLPSGLQYKVITAGNGPSPKLTDKVKTHYHGTLIDGTVFDSSVKRGEPIEFPVSGVIRGWTEALQLMKVGDKWQLVIPSELAYGPRGAGDVIGPNATLVFEVELLDIVK